MTFCRARNFSKAFNVASFFFYSKKKGENDILVLSRPPMLQWRHGTIEVGGLHAGDASYVSV